MGILSEGTEQERLLQARQVFEWTIDYHDLWLDEINEDRRFHHGKQWDEADIEKLRKEQRPVLTFNVTQGKILHMIGAGEDNLQDPKVVPVDVEDMLPAEALNRIKDRIYAELEMETIDGEVFEDGIVSGIGQCAVDVQIDADSIDNVKIMVTPIWPEEVLWDPASKRRDKRDARFFFWSRWFTKSEFQEEYPGMGKSELNELFSRDGTGLMHALKPELQRRIVDEAHSGLPGGHDFEYRRLRRSIYYDRRRRMVRVIHMEYKRAVKVHWMRSVATGTSRKVEEKDVSVLKEEFGSEVTFTTLWADEVSWFEFTSNKVLHDDTAPVFDREFSVIPFICNSDEQNLPYGKVRMLRDPNREANKRYSQTLHLLTAQGAPGLFAEEDAVMDVQQARVQMVTSNGIVLLQRGGLAKIKERGIPKFPDSAARMIEMSLKLLDLISGITADDLTTPRGIPEAAATTQMKHRKSMLAMKPILRAFRSFQSKKLKLIMHGVLNYMDDTQLVEILGAPDKFLVEQGMLIDPSRNLSYPIRDMRKLKYDIRMRMADSNNTERLMQLQTAMGAAQLGIPIDPSVIYDLMALPEDMKIRLKAFAAQTQASQAQEGQAQLQSSSQALESELDFRKQELAQKGEIEAGKISVSQAAEIRQGWKDMMDFRAKMAAVFEKADATEKNHIMAMISEVLEANKARESQTLN